MDRLIAARGEYQPLELILASGGLPYSRYEAWRAGELEALEDGLAGSREHLVRMLHAAAGWAAALGLVPSEEAYRGWDGATRSLCLFRDPCTDRLARTHYRREAGAPQLDIFFDSGATAALNDLCNALAARDAGEAGRRLALLAEVDPRHRLFATAGTLVDALGRLGRPVENPAGELAAIEGHLALRAEELLGPRARDFLAPFWRRLAAALPAERFDPAAERLHPSWVAAHYLDWPGVAAAVEAVAEYARFPVLLGRLAEARLRASERTAGLVAACRLCWRAPDVAAVWIDRITDRMLVDARERFWDLDADLSPAWFPAWLLIDEPGLAHHLPERLGADHGVPGRAFAVIHRLRTGGDDLALRGQLKRLSEGLFRAWLEQARG